MRLIETAPAKINLTLAVHGRRSDGYHTLTSLVAFAADAGDLLSLDPDGPPSVTVTGSFAADLVGQNIVARTLDMLAAEAPELALGAVAIEKALPVASGIGGGSADAAALLRLVRRLNADHPVAAGLDWMAMAARLGADVPVCYVARGSVMTGIGEIVAPLADFPRLDAVLVNPGAHVPADKTAQVFCRLAAPPLASGGPHAVAGSAMAASMLDPPLDRAELIRRLQAEGNDLEAPALAVVPEIADVLAVLRHTRGCLLARMSGAGPTSFAIYADRSAAEAAAFDLQAARPNWWVRATRLA